MRRRLFNLAAAVSLVLCVATVALWTPSYRHWDGVTFSSGRVCYGVVSHPFNAINLMLFRKHTGTATLPTEQGWELGTEARSLTDTEVRWHDFVASSFTIGSDQWQSTVWYVTLPYWALSVATAIPPLGCILRRKRRRSTSELCPTCGYDLRATPYRCPECGEGAAPGSA
jgi:hypothetical protein